MYDIIQINIFVQMNCNLSVVRLSNSSRVRSDVSAEGSAEREFKKALPQKNSILLSLKKKKGPMLFAVRQAM